MSFLPVKFVFFLKSRLLFNVFYCFCMFVNKHFTYLRCANLKAWKVLKCAICVLLFFMLRRIFHICISVPLTCYWMSRFNFCPIHHKIFSYQQSTKTIIPFQLNKSMIKFFNKYIAYIKKTNLRYQMSC